MFLGVTVPQKATQYVPGSRDYLTLGDSLDSQPKQVGYLHDSDPSHVANKLFFLIVESFSLSLSLSLSLRMDHCWLCHGGTGVASVLLYGCLHRWLNYLRRYIHKYH